MALYISPTLFHLYSLLFDLFGLFGGTGGIGEKKTDILYLNNKKLSRTILNSPWNKLPNLMRKSFILLHYITLNVSIIPKKIRAVGRGEREKPQPTTLLGGG